MKNVLYLTGLGLLSSSLAMAGGLELSSPYVGAELQGHYVAFKKGEGKGIFPKAKHPYLQGNLFLGVKFSNYVGLEAGYEASESRTRVATNSGPDFVMMGRQLELDETTVTDDYAKLNSPYASLIGFLPLDRCQMTQLIGVVGIAYPKLKLIHREIANELGSYPEATIRDFIHRKPVLRLGLGIQTMLVKNLGIRGMVNWENLSRFKNLAPKQKSNYRVSLKDSFQYGLGLFWKF